MNRFPTNYAEMIASGQLLPECEPGTNSVEYCFEDENKTDSTYIFVIDCSVRPSEVQAIKECLKDTFSKLPENVSIALITFTRYIQIYEMGSVSSVKSLIIDGKETLNVEKIQSLLDITPSSKKAISQRFFVNV